MMVLSVDGLPPKGAVDSPKSLSHPMGQKGKWWNLVSIKWQN
jgi:hypothetical protein